MEEDNDSVFEYNEEDFFWTEYYAYVSINWECLKSYLGIYPTQEEEEPLHVISILGSVFDGG